MTNQYQEQKQTLQQYQQAAASHADSARCLPFAAYRDQQLWHQEATQIFHREWVFACAEQQLPEAGCYFAFRLAGEAIAIIRNKQGQIRALSNICRHRGTPLLDEGFGKIDKLITCPYHAWAYDMDGQIKGIPLTGDHPPDKSTHCLPHFSVDSWHGLLFVNLDTHAQPLAERLSGMDDYLSAFELSRFSAGFCGETEQWHCNWKLAMENAMESYHLFKVHQQTLETTTPTRSAFYLAGSSEWTLTAGKIQQKRSKLMSWLSGDYPDIYNHYVLISLPPSFVGILTYESFDWIQVLPEDETHCVIRSGGISTSLDGYQDKHSREFTQAFFAEDKEICERVQTGMSSQFTQGGSLVDMERVVVDFHQYLASRLFSHQPPAFYQSDEANMFLNSTD